MNVTLSKPPKNANRAFSNSRRLFFCKKSCQNTERSEIACENENMDHFSGISNNKDKDAGDSSISVEVDEILQPLLLYRFILQLM